MLDISIDEPKPFKLVNPHGLDQAVALGGRENAAFLAGGGDLLEQLKTQWRSPELLISLKALQDLRGIQKEHGAVTIGALTTLSALERDEDLRSQLPALSLAAARVATPQIRNTSTVGGNLLQDSRCAYYRDGWDCLRAGGDVCHALLGVHTEHAIFGAWGCHTVTPSDLAPALVALDAQATIHGQEGTQTLPVAELFIAPKLDIRHMHRLQNGEVLTKVIIPLKQEQRSTFVKYAARAAWDFAIVSAAVAAIVKDGTVHHCSIVLGAVAAIPWRSREAESVLKGAALTDDTIKATVEATVQAAEPLSGNAYKVPLVRKVVTQALQEIAQ